MLILLRLVPAIEKYSRHVVLIGEAAQDIAAVHW